VIDVGSNSIRLVVYDRLFRSPVPILNEKVMCGLGRDLAETGRLSREGRAQALDNLIRFRRLLEGMDVDRVDVLATAAVRDAADGTDFVAEVERRSGLPMTIVPGVEEARLSALGVLSGLPAADGVTGDLGGGSLEVVGIDRGTLREQATLPLGPFRLMHEHGLRADSRAATERALAGLPWLSRYAGRNFYPVGGAWRALAKLHMDHATYPLHVIHAYTVPARQFSEFAGLIARQGAASLVNATGISRRRVETLPAAAMVLETMLRLLSPRQVVFSAYGLREGHLYDLLPADEQAEDPLLAAAADLAHRMDRFGHAEVVAQWTAPVFVDETAAEARLRQAASLLSDIGWAEHPDYRAQHAFLRALRLPFAGLDHTERAFLAIALYARYGGRPGDGTTLAAEALLDADALARAERIGLTLRLAHTLTGGATSLLARTRLSVDGEFLQLALPADEQALTGDVVSRRLETLGRAMRKTGRVVIGG
jgi:exopolyphosphatase/guanosine-5'-triphosphate,3'-diphosphate pyrophosphatase